LLEDANIIGAEITVVPDDGDPIVPQASYFDGLYTSMGGTRKEHGFGGLFFIPQTAQLPEQFIVS